jgi:hypothetical protein
MIFGGGSSQVRFHMVCAWVYIASFISRLGPVDSQKSRYKLPFAFFPQYDPQRRICVDSGVGQSIVSGLFCAPFIYSLYERNQLWAITAMIGAALCGVVLIVIGIVALNPVCRPHLDRVSFRILVWALAAK